jgi:hypothetical protein
MAELTLSDGTRSLELIGTGGTGIWLKQDGLNLPVVGKELTYAESADSEGRRRIRSKPQNAEGSFSVFISHPTDATFWDYVDNLQELVESAHENKGTITYTPPGGTQVTFDLESIQVANMPQSGINLRNNIAEVDVTFECLPYGRLPKQRMNLDASYEEAVTALSPSIFLPLAGSAPLTDLSGNARNGTAAGGVTAGGYTPGPLTVGDTGATDFDGTDDRITTTYATRRNLFTNPSVEVNATSFANAGTGTITRTRVNTQAYVGSWSMEYICDGTVASQGARSDSFDVAALTAYTFSAYVKAPAGKAMWVEVQERDAADASIGITPVNFTGTDDWQLVSATRTFGATGVKARWQVRANSSATAAYTFYIDALLFEAASSAGTYFPTVAQLASGEAGWTGTANASASDIGCFANGTSRTFMGWAYKDTSAATMTLIGANPATTWVRLPNGTLDINFRPDSTAGGVTAAAAIPALNQWFHWAVTFDEATDAIKIYVNGAEVLSTTSATQYPATVGALQIGLNSASYFDGKQAWVSIHNRALTAGEIATLANFDVTGTVPVTRKVKTGGGLVTA